MIHIPGIKHIAPDTLSRYPTADPHPPKMGLQDNIRSIIDGAHTPPPLHIPTQLIAGNNTDDQLHSHLMENRLQDTLLSTLHSTHTVNWEQVQTPTSSDDNMLQLMSTIEDGIPALKSDLPQSIREYHQHRNHIYSSDGVVIYKNRIVIPPSLRPACLSALHTAHQGTASMISKAEASIFWPGIT